MRNFIVIISVVGLFFLGLLAFAMAGSIAGPIEELRQGTEIIGRGNWEHKVSLAARDEIGDLSRAFDKMVESLKSTTASRDELEREIAARQKVEEKTLMLSQAVEQSSAAVVITDPDGIIEYVNPAFEKITGYTAAETKGRNPRLLKSGHQSQPFYKNLWDTISSGQVWRGEFCNNTKSGRMIWESASISPIKDARGRIIAFVAVEEDTTERREREDRLRALKQELEVKNQELLKLDQMKSDFVSTVSHELRTPLAIISQGVSLLSRKILGDVNEKQQDILRDVIDNIERLVKLIDNLLDMAKLESGQAALDLGPVDPAELVSKTVSSFQRKAEEKKISLQSDILCRLPFVYADKDKLVQVLTNLCGNALKFTPEHGRVTLSAAKTDDGVEFSVSDTGVGIAKDNIPHLFKKFQQFNRTSGSGEKGTGLGLAICQEIVHMHGGKIWAVSPEGKGSTFHFSIPVKPGGGHDCPSPGGG